MIRFASFDSKDAHGCSAVPERNASPVYGEWDGGSGCCGRKTASLALIGSELSICEGTVKKHVTNLRDKLSTSKRTHAVNCARQVGLII